MKRNPLRYSCEIGFKDKLVITGGTDNDGTYGKTIARVTSYTFNGFLADLPDMNEARSSHSCTHYLNNDNKIVGSMFNMYHDRDHILQNILLSRFIWWQVAGPPLLDILIPQRNS